MIILHHLAFISLCIGVSTGIVKSFRASEALIFAQCKKNHDFIIVNGNIKLLQSSWIEQLHEQFYSAILLRGFRYRKQFSRVKKVDGIVIILSSNSQSSIQELNQNLISLHRTPWWNVMTPVYVLHSPDHSCELAEDLLILMWKYDILMSYYLCIQNNELQIYTYNPFANRAPSYWKEVQRSSSSSKISGWTLYHRTYHSQTICKRWDFDRTKYLAGHPITIAIPATTEKKHSLIGQHIDYNDWNNDGHISERRYHFLIDALVLKLKVRASLYIIRKEVDSRDVNTLYLDYVKEISNNFSVNLILTAFYLPKELFKKAGLTQTYPLAWNENGIATYNRGCRTFAEKIWDFYGLWTILFSIFILLITFIVVQFSENRGTAFAIFELIRLSTGHGLQSCIKSLPLRIFFIAMLIYFLIIEATFNGHLAKFLTKPELRKHGETREDLRDLGYTKIYDAKYAVDHLAITREELIMDKALVRMCLNHILYNDSSVAFILNRYLLLEYSQLQNKKNFYISRKSTESLYSIFFIRNHWSLSDRVNLVIMSLEEFGFRQLISSDQERKLTHNLTISEARSNTNFQPLQLENLMFSFSFLAIGLISATVSFCVETIINYNSKLNNNVF